MLGVRWRWMVIDLLAWIGSALIAVEVRFEFSPPAVYVFNYLLVGTVAAGLQLLIGYAFGVYRGRYRTATFEDFIATCLLVGSIATGVTFALWVLPFQSFPISTAFASAFFALSIMLAARALRRIQVQRTSAFSPYSQRVLLLGAGDAGEQLARSIRRDPLSEWDVVGFLDDSPNLRHLKLEGVRVLGTSRDIAKVSKKYNAHVVIVSIARAESDLLNEIAERCAEANVQMLVLPSVSQLISTTVDASDVREVEEADLLGRTVVETDLDAIAEMIHGRCVLVTGAGGSIGSELVRRIHPFGPSKLLLLDRDESALHALHLSIYGSALMDSEELVLADIRDEERIAEIFEEARPDIVFHAAALKHLPMLENAPAEALKTNIVGTVNVLRAAQKVDVTAFINISTDKAADPISVLGYSKRITERLTAGVDEVSAGRYVSVRFGNVLGSRGSMLGTFQGQIEAGGPVTVTHPEVSRYFMTIQEAVQLVLQASVVGRGGEVLVLDMGEPVRIVDVAKRLIKHSGSRVEIAYTGLRFGEKLHEDLVAHDEKPVRDKHPLIMHVTTPPLSMEQVTCSPDLTADHLKTWMIRASMLPVGRQVATIPAQTIRQEPVNGAPKLRADTTFGPW